MISVGQQVGGYTIVSRIGQGGMGDVFLAQHLRVDRRAAVKVLLPELSTRKDVLDRFFTEARATSLIKHPGIVEILDCDVVDDQAFIIMEYLDGESLGSYLKHSGPLGGDPVFLVGVGAAIAKAVGAAHALGIVHRDLKPDNVYLHLEHGNDAQVTVKIVDFGIAKLAQPEGGGGNLTQTGATIGTPAYMSPEQARGARQVDLRSDIYSLGCILYEMACGQPPFVREGFGELLMAQISETPKPPLERVPTLAPALSKVILHLLAKEPGDRPQSMAQVLDELNACADEAQLSVDGPLLPRQRVRRPPTAPVDGAAPAPAAPGWMSTRSSMVPPTRSSPMGASAAPAPTHYPAPAGWAPTLSTTSTSVSAAGFRSAAPVASPDALTLWPTPSWTAVELALPSDMKAALPAVQRFLQAMFGNAESVAPELVRLTQPQLAHGESHDFFALFISDTGGLQPQAAPLGHLATRIFVDRAADLRRHLEQMPATRTKVVLVIARAGDLAAGIREVILDYRQKYDAVVVPLYIGELERWTRGGDAGNVAELFEQRLQSLHTRPDPYAQRGLSSDPTQFVEMNDDLTNVVAQIREFGGVINITGQPGCGKSALLHMAEYGCRDRRFVYVSAGDASHRDPATMASELVDAVAGTSSPPKRKTDPMFAIGGAGGLAASLDEQLKKQERRARVGQPVIRTMITSITPAPGQGGTPQPLVLAIEDADWLIDLLYAPDSESQRRGEAQSFWSALAELARLRRLTVLVTSVRGFALGEEVVAGWTNPVKPRSIPLRPLDQRGLRNLIVTLGLSINLNYSPRAVRRIFELTGGNIFVARALCSAIVRAARADEGHHPLAPHTVSPAEVRRAARSLIATQSFGDSFMRWCNEIERDVLQFVATASPRTLHSLRRALEERHPASAINTGIKTVQNMQLMGFSHGRHQVTVRLTQEWIREHLDASVQRRMRMRHRRANQVAIGLATTVMLGAVYYAWFSPRRLSTPTHDAAGCSFSADYPELAAVNQDVTVYLFRDCGQEPFAPMRLLAPHAPVHIAQAECPPADPRCFAEAKVHLLETSARGYDFQLAVDGVPAVGFHIQKDPIAEFRALASRAMQIAALLPAALTLIFAFHRDILDFIRRVFRLPPAAPEKPAAGA